MNAVSSIPLSCYRPAISDREIINDPNVLSTRGDLLIVTSQVIYCNSLC